MRLFFVSLLNCRQIPIVVKFFIYILIVILVLCWIVCYVISSQVESYFWKVLVPLVSRVAPVVWQMIVIVSLSHVTLNLLYIAFLNHPVNLLL